MSTRILPADTGGPIRAVFYGRKSNDDRGELGESIEQQRQWATEAAARDAVVIVREFSDQSVSGWDTARRSGFAEMLAFCKEQHRLGSPVEALVCYHPNRFSRSDSLETSRFLCEFRDAGVSRMLTAGKWIDFNRPEDRMLFGLEQEANSHRYSTDLSRVTMRGKRAAATKGLWGGGKAPFGYCVEGRKLIPHPTEAEHLKWLFETYATTDVSIWALLKKLQERGVRSPKGKELWRSATVAKVLRNPLYLGDAIFGRANYSPFVGSVAVKATRKPISGQPKPQAEWITVEGTHPPLIDRETFDKVQVRLAKNRNRKSSRKVAPFPLSGLLVCGKCGRRMVAETNHVRANEKVHKYRVYTCASYHINGTASGCGRNTVDDGAMIRAVVRKLAVRFTAPEAVAALRAEIARQEQEAAPTDRAAELEGRFTDLGRRIGKLVERLEDDLPEEVLGDVRNRIRALSDERDRVRTELASVKAATVAAEPTGERVERLVKMIERLEEAVKRADPATVSEMLRGLLDRVEVFFTTKQEGKRTRTLFARALLYLNPIGWATPSSNLANCVGIQATKNARRFAELLREFAPSVKVVAPPPPRQPDLFGEE